MMKGKVWIYRFLIAVGFCLLIGFVIRVGADAYQYKMYSAPFYYTVIFHVIEFVIPAVFLLVTGFVLRKKVKKGEV